MNPNQILCAVESAGGSVDFDFLNSRLSYRIPARSRHLEKHILKERDAIAEIMLKRIPPVVWVDTIQ